MGGLIYTANFGNYDRPRPVSVREPGVDYMMVTDGDGAEGWTVHRVKKADDSRAVARLVKVTMPLVDGKNYDWTLWVDGNIEITGEVSGLVQHWLREHDFAAMKHPWWQCSYTEIDKCIELDKDTNENLEAARTYLKGEEFPRNYGQLATWILLRKNTEFVQEHAKAWWADMAAMTMRDQVTFMLNLWRLGVGIEWMQKGPKANEWATDWCRFKRGHR